jgi:hypothetical protein
MIITAMYSDDSETREWLTDFSIRDKRGWKQHMMKRLKIHATVRGDITMLLTRVSREYCCQLDK